jgi:integrase
MPVRSRDEVARLLAAVRSPVIALLLRTIYATGMRLGEALALHPSQIDSRQMVLRVIGKGNKERIIPLSPLLLEELRAYWVKVRPTRFLFPGKSKERKLCASSVQRACQKICKEQGLARLTPHTLRHNADSRIMPTWPLATSRLAVFRPFMELTPLADAA